MISQRMNISYFNDAFLLQTASLTQLKLCTTNSTSRVFGTYNSNYKPQNSKHKTQNTELKTQNTKHKTQNSKHKTLITEQKI